MKNILSFNLKIKLPSTVKEESLIEYFLEELKTRIRYCLVDLNCELDFYLPFLVTEDKDEAKSILILSSQNGKKYYGDLIPFLSSDERDKKYVFKLITSEKDDEDYTSFLFALLPLRNFSSFSSSPLSFSSYPNFFLDPQPLIDFSQPHFQRLIDRKIRTDEFESQHYPEIARNYHIFPSFGEIIMAMFQQTTDPSHIWSQDY